LRIRDGVAEALAVARRQSAPRAEAGDLPAETYGWFTEGLDTADSTAARALLEEPGRPAERRESRPRSPEPSS